MTINTKSWHYRFLSQMKTYPMPTSLCSYFWTLIGKMIVAAAVVWLGALLTIGYPVLAWAAFHNHSDIAFGMLGAIITIPLFTGLVFLYDYIRRKSQKLGQSRNLVVQMIRATKNKVCPLITYEGEE